MTELITLNIPLKSYLKKYLTHKYGITHCVSKRSWLGCYFVDLCKYKNYRQIKGVIVKEDFYTISIPTSIIKDVGFDISTTKIKNLVEMIDKVFLNDLFSYIEVSIGSDLKFINEKYQSVNKQNKLLAITQFLEFHGISEDEKSTETLYRAFGRMRKTDKEKKT